MERHLPVPGLNNSFLPKLFPRYRFSPGTSSQVLSVETDRDVPADAIVEPVVTESVEVDYLEDRFQKEGTNSSRKRSKKRKIYCFNCNRQEFHIMAYKGTMLHSFLVGMSFGLARIFGPYRCTCCGKTRAMFADYCSLSYHWRMASERRLSNTGRRRSRSSRRKR